MKLATLSSMPQPLPGLPLGTAAPDFTIGEFRLSSLRGKVVLLDFWAAWCPPCKQTLPKAQKLKDELGSRGLEVVAVCTTTSVEQLQNYLNQNPPYTLTILNDETEPEDAVGYRLYNIDGYPSFFLIDRQGTVVQFFKGFNDRNDEQTLREAIEKLL